MIQDKIRNSSFNQGLSPVCTKIKNASLDMYSAFKRKEQQKFKLAPIVVKVDVAASVELKNSSQSSVEKMKKPLFKQKLPSISDNNAPDNKVPDKKVPEVSLRHLKSENLVSLSSKGQKSFERKLKNLKSLKRPRKSDLGSYSSLKLKPKAIRITYEEASKYLDWTLIAKPEIEAMWRTLIYSSYGIQPVQEKVVYKYFIGKGNNSEMVRSLMAARKWWTETLVLSEANFIWTQWNENQVFQLLPKGENMIHEFDTTFTCSLTYQVPVKIGENYRQVDISDLGLEKIKNNYSFTALKTKPFIPSKNRVYNKLEFNSYLSDKKGLLGCLTKYYEMVGQDVFNVHPVSFHVKDQQDPKYKKFLENFESLEKRKSKNKIKNVWIVKPAENSNRGQGITVCKTLDEINSAIDAITSASNTFIIQKYIEKPFLIHSRKFDIRCFVLVACINGILQAYFYSDGYIRTSSVEFSLLNTENKYIHLTNDAVQKQSQDYGRFEDNNKMTYKEFQGYLDLNYFDKKFNFIEDVVPKVRNLVKDTISAAYFKLDSNKRVNCMEILGYDFMLDYKLKPWIIEVNTNPCLEMGSGCLRELIPRMVDNAFRVVVDCCFPQGSVGKNTFEPIGENRFELVFHELSDGLKVKSLRRFDSGCSETE